MERSEFPSYLCLPQNTVSKAVGFIVLFLGISLPSTAGNSLCLVERPGAGLNNSSFLKMGVRNMSAKACGDEGKEERRKRSVP